MSLKNNWGSGSSSLSQSQAEARALEAQMTLAERQVAYQEQQSAAEQERQNSRSYVRAQTLIANALNTSDDPRVIAILERGTSTLVVDASNSRVIAQIPSNAIAQAGRTLASLQVTTTTELEAELSEVQAEINKQISRAHIEKYHLKPLHPDAFASDALIKAIESGEVTQVLSVRFEGDHNEVQIIEIDHPTTPILIDIRVPVLYLVAEADVPDLTDNVQHGSSDFTTVSRWTGLTFGDQINAALDELGDDVFEFNTLLSPPVTTQGDSHMVITDAGSSFNLPIPITINTSDSYNITFPGLYGYQFDDASYIAVNNIKMPWTIQHFLGNDGFMKQGIKGISLSKGSYTLTLHNVQAPDTIDHSKLPIYVSKEGGVNTSLQTTLDVYTQNNSQMFTGLTKIDEDNYVLKTAELNPAKDTWIIIHGMNSSAGNDIDGANNIARLYDAVDQVAESDNRVVLDWNEYSHMLADGQPLGGVDYAPMIAKLAADELKSKGIDPAKINIIGHSWGTIVGAELARNLGGVNSIVALDTAVDLRTNDYDVSWIDFSELAKKSYALEGSWSGDNDRTTTAHQSFKVAVSHPDLPNFGFATDISGATENLWHNQIVNHGVVVDAFSNLLKDGDSEYGKLFSINNIRNAANLNIPGVINAFDTTVNNNGETVGYEALLRVDVGLNIPLIVDTTRDAAIKEIFVLQPNDEDPNEYDLLPND